MTIVEVGPRDGLQNEPVVLSTADKVAFITRLIDAGLRTIEVGSFVSPTWVPQMADTAEVLAGLRASGAPADVTFVALVPNMTGFARAQICGVGQIAVVAAASDTFSRKNLNQSIDESLATCKAVCAAALASGMRVRGYLSTCFGCPYEGAVPPDRVVTLTRRLLDLGVFEVAVSDTIGVAHPGQVRRLLDALLAVAEAPRIAVHFHDTRGMGVANVLAALDYGITTVDASAGGLGGCPYAPGAAGNVATEDVIYLLEGLGIETGVRLPGVLEASRFVAGRLGRRLTARVAQAYRPTTANEE